MSNEKDVLMGVLTKTLNKTETEVTDLLYQKSDDENSDELILNEDALTLVLDQDASRVKNIKKSTATPEEITESFKKGLSQGKAETIQKMEKELKTVANIESDATGNDLVKEVVNAISECNMPSDDQIKIHPMYIEMEKTKKAEYDSKVSEFDDYKLNQDKIQRLGKVKREVITIFQGLNPIVSENPVVAQTRQDDLLSKFESYDYELSEDGDHLITLNGTRQEDKHGNAVKFADFVKDIASMSYDFQVSDDVGNAGNVNTGNNGQNTKVDVPKDEKEYLAKYAELKLAGRTDDATALNLAWNALQSK